MASLRTAFIEAFIPGQNVFYALVAYFPIIFHPAGAAQDIGKEKKVPVFRDRVSTKVKQVSMPHLGQPNPSLRALQGIVNMHINNFSQILDINSNDFKDCQNLVHVLELDQEEKIFSFSQVQTINSFTYSVSQPQLTTTIQKNSQEDFSEVEDIEN